MLRLFFFFIALARVFIPGPRELRLLNGTQNVTVDCLGYGKPLPTVRWTRNGSFILEVNNVTGKHSNELVQVTEMPRHNSAWNATSRLYLHINGVTYQDAGNYTCVVFNGVVMNFSAEDTVQVLCKYLIL